MKFRLHFSAVAAFSFALAAAAPAQSTAPAPQWFKGNLHTHSLWSDGDDYPEMIADWYKRNGYHFLAISDHNVIQVGTRWFELKQPVAPGGQVMQRGAGTVFQKYLDRFGPDWVEVREENGKREVRLKPLDEYRELLEESGKFLMIPSEEISSTWKRAKTETTAEATLPVHINVHNLRDKIDSATGSKAADVISQVMDAVVAQREKTGQPMIAHLNHPNFRWAFPVEDMIPVRNERFFEVYNGHPGVNNDGDATRLSMDAMWDVMLAHRLTDLNLPLVYGVGVDDSHHYHELKIGRSNSGRGWIMVRARRLTAESIIRAMEAGDFYASNGVTLADVRSGNNELALEVKPEAGVSYTIQFIGTRKNFDRTTTPLPPPADDAKRNTPMHHRYSKDIGAVLAEVKGTRASYKLKGDEIYVRAKVISSKPKHNGSVESEMEMAWTQPLVNTAAASGNRTTSTR